MSNLCLTVAEAMGLTENEAVIYDIALNKGPLSILQLSRMSGIKRTTVYITVERLIKQGLLNLQMQDSRKYYAAASPQKLEMMLNKKRELLDKAMPDLMSMYHGLSEREGFIKHYEGLEAIKSVYDHMLTELNPGDFYLVISNTEKWYQLDPEYFESFRKRRAKLNLSIRLLLEDNEAAREYFQKEQEYNVEIKLFPSKKFLNTTMAIVPKQIVIVQTVPPFLALVIQNANVIHMNRLLFDLLWESRW